MKPARRWFQYSLRSFLILLTALAVWLGVVVNRAREQREAVKAIAAMRGEVVFDWQPRVEPQPGGTIAIVYYATHWTNYFTPAKGKPGGPAWLRRLVGNEYFQEAHTVQFPYHPFEADILKTIPHIQSLRTVKVIRIGDYLSPESHNALRMAVPGVELDIVRLTPDTKNTKNRNHRDTGT